MNWAAWLAERPDPALVALAKRINRELLDCSALLSRDVGADHAVWIVCDTRQAFIHTWEEAQAFAGLAVQGKLFR